MSAIMIDNWSIDSFVAFVDFGYTYDFLDKESYKKQYKVLEKAWINFLSAIMLWDEVWFYKHHLSQFWQQEMEQMMADDRCKKPLSAVKSILKEVNVDLRMIKGVIDDPEIFPDKDKTKTSIRERSKFYLVISNILGISYLAHPERGAHIDDFGKQLFNRMELIEKIDKELIEYYLYINKRLGREHLNFKYPVLYDLVRYNSSGVYDQLNTALSLRNDNDLITFRNEISEIEQLVNSGNTQSLLTQLDIISEIAKKVTEKYKKMKIGQFSLGLTPSISLPIQIKVNPNMKIHTAFIKRLIDFGVNKRA